MLLCPQPSAEEGLPVSIGERWVEAAQAGCFSIVAAAAVIVAAPHFWHSPDQPGGETAHDPATPSYSQVQYLGDTAVSHR